MKTAVTTKYTKHTKWQADNNAGAFTRRGNTHGMVSGSSFVWFVYFVV